MTTAETEENKALLAENQTLKQQLAEAQETLRAIHHGEVDALVVSTPQGPQVYTLTGAETLYRLLIEEMREGAVMLCDDNTILYCNKGFAGMVKLPLDKLIGTNIENAVAQTHLEQFKALLSACRLGRGEVTREITFKTNGDITPTFVSGSSLTINGSTTTFIVVTDLSKHMEEELKLYTADLEETVRERTKQLQEKERLAAIGQTAGMVGHDIRNPLQSIVSELFLARQELEVVPDSDAKKGIVESLSSIEEQTFYINKIVADLQDFTKPLTPKLQSINLEDSVHESLTSIVIPQNIQIEIHLPKNPKINTDSFLIKRILVNLISNALQAMPNGGKLTLSTTFSSKEAKITVKDTGHGISEEVKPQIFQPLFTTKAKGQGLGLAVVKRLTEALGGAVSFESEVGKGTAFIVTLPLSNEK